MAYGSLTGNNSITLSFEVNLGPKPFTLYTEKETKSRPTFKEREWFVSSPTPMLSIIQAPFCKLKQNEQRTNWVLFLNHPEKKKSHFENGCDVILNLHTWCNPWIKWALDILRSTLSAFNLIPKSSSYSSNFVQFDHLCTRQEAILFLFFLKVRFWK